jgi:UDP-N-acetylglucosamine 2-epimerase (non-hydrolysing)
MIDSLMAFEDEAESSTILDRLGLRTDGGCDGGSIARYGLLTLHRPSNVDDPESILNILAGLEDLLADCLVVFPAHPRTRHRIVEFGLEHHLLRDATGGTKGMVLTDPLGYLDFLCLMKHAMIVVTDSGGIQEETTILGVPCVTVRENTERPVTVEQGTNIIAGTQREKIGEAVRSQLKCTRGYSVPKYWDGQAAGRIVDVLIQASLKCESPI